MTKSNRSMIQPQQLNLFQLMQEYPQEIVKNSSQEIDLDDIDIAQNVLICNVKKDNMEHFLDGITHQDMVVGDL